RIVGTAMIIDQRPSAANGKTADLASSHVQPSLARVARVSGDGAVIGGVPAIDGAEGRDHRVKGVAAAVAHDDAAMRGTDLHPLAQSLQNRASRAQSFAGQRAALWLLVVLVREAEPLERRTGARLDDD